MPAPVVVVAGPTACGKSALALDLAERFDGVVVNADSMQLYRELEILSARPGPDALARVPHQLYGILRADNPCSAGRWHTMARCEIEDAHARGKLPIVTGGTGLYLKTLSEGIAPVPAIEPALRTRLRRALNDEGAGALHARLARIDPEGAKSIRESDPQRIVRALEVVEQTGQPLHHWHARQDGVHAPPWRLAQILVLPDRETIYAACDARFDEMIAAGALEEARWIAELGLTLDTPPMKAVGLAPLIAQAEGRIDADEAARWAKRDTRRYARRQMTWFRHQMAPDLVLGEQFSKSMHSRIFSFISYFRLTVPG